MYPLPIVVAGCGDSVLPAVRRELLNGGIKVDALLPSMNSAVQRRDELGKGPKLFIVQLEKLEDRKELRRLSRAYPGKPILALMPGDSGVADVVEAMRAGACQVALAPPLNPRDLGTALDCIASQHGQSLNNGQVLAVSGATGGCGATTLAINLAYDLAQLHGKNVILAETNLLMGMLVSCLNINPEYNLEDLITYPEDLDVHVVEQSLMNCGERLRVLSGPERPIPTTPEVAAKLATIISYLRNLSDIVVLDLPCTFDDAYFETLLSADQAIIVGEQRIPSVRNIQLVMNTLGGEQLHKVRLVVNRYDARFEGFTLPDLKKLLEHESIVAFGNDTNVPFALNRGAVLRQVAPQAPYLAELEGLTHDLLNIQETVEVSVASPTVFGRFCHALGLA